MGLVGRLEDLGISDIFQILGIGKKTGTLLINTHGGAARIQFKDGFIVSAESTISKTLLSEDLLKAGFLKESTFKMARSVLETLPGKQLFDVLLDMGAVKKDLLERAAKKKIEKIVYKVMHWTEGDFQFELDETPQGGNGSAIPQGEGWMLSRGLAPEYLLMEGARIYDESSRGGLDVAQDEDLDFGAEAGDEEQHGEGDDWGGDWGGGGAERKDISSLKALTQELRFPNSTSEITLLILRFASEIYQRGVLFMVGPSEIAGLGQFGLELERADERVRQIHLGYQESPFLSGLIRLARNFKGAVTRDAVTEALFRELGGEWPDDAAFFPLVAEGGVVALLYCDNGGAAGEASNSEGLEIFISHAGLAIEKALLQRKIQEFERGNN